MMRINGETKVVGLMGDPVKHTLSPAMHNAAFKKLELNYRYLPFHVYEEELGQALEGVRAMQLRGINLTIPLKEKALDFLDHIDKQAGLIGAVNTVVNKCGQLYGYNTDGQGFLSSLELSGFSIENKNILIFGAGGAARGVSIPLAFEGAHKIVFINRTLSKADKLSRLISNIQLKKKVKSMSYLPSNTKAVERNVLEADLIINATPVGMNEEDGLPPGLIEDYLHSGQYIYDMIYSPQVTPLLEAARNKNAEFQNGLNMLILQGAEAFKLWTGENPPLEVMREVIT